MAEKSSTFGLNTPKYWRYLSGETRAIDPKTAQAYGTETARISAKGQSNYSSLNTFERRVYDFLGSQYGGKVKELKADTPKHGEIEAEAISGGPAGGNLRDTVKIISDYVRTIRAGGPPQPQISLQVTPEISAAFAAQSKKPRYMPQVQAAARYVPGVGYIRRPDFGTPAPTPEGFRKVSVPDNLELSTSGFKQIPIPKELLGAEPEPLIRYITGPDHKPQPVYIYSNPETRRQYVDEVNNDPNMSPLARKGMIALYDLGAVMSPSGSLNLLNVSQIVEEKATEDPATRDKFFSAVGLVESWVQGGYAMARDVAYRAFSAPAVAIWKSQLSGLETQILNGDINPDDIIPGSRNMTYSDRLNGLRRNIQHTEQTWINNRYDSEIGWEKFAQAAKTGFTDGISEAGEDRAIKAVQANEASIDALSADIEANGPIETRDFPGRLGRQTYTIDKRKQLAALQKENIRLKNDYFYREYLQRTERMKAEEALADTEMQTINSLRQQMSFATTEDEAKQYVMAAKDHALEWIDHWRASTVGEAYGSYTWATEPNKELQFRNALAEYIIQVGRAPTTEEVRQIKAPFENMATEFTGNMLFDPWNLTFLAERLAAHGIQLIKETTNPIVRDSLHALGKMGLPKPIASLADESFRSIGTKLSDKSYSIMSRMFGAGYRGADDFYKDIGRFGSIGDEIADLLERDPQRAEEMFKSAKAAGNARGIKGLQNITWDEFKDWAKFRDMTGRSFASLRGYFEAAENAVEKERLALITHRDSNAIKDAAWKIKDAAERAKFIADETERLGKLAIKEANQDARSKNGVAAATKIVSDRLGFEYINKQRSFRGSLLLKDTVLGMVAEHLFKQGNKDEALIIDSFARLSTKMKSTWAQWVLSMNPGYVMRNLIDTSFRDMIYGGNMFDDWVSVFRHTESQFADQLGFIPAEFSQSLARADLPFEETVASRLLIAGWKPKFGPLSFIGYEWNRLGRASPAEKMMKLSEMRAAGYTKGQIYDAVRANISNGIKNIWQAGAIRPVKAFSGGMADFNTSIEFAVRLKMFNREYFKNIRLAESLYRDPTFEGMSKESKNIAQQMWSDARHNPNRMAAMVDRIVSGKPLSREDLKDFLTLMPPGFGDLMYGGPNAAENQGPLHWMRENTEDFIRATFVKHGRLPNEAEARDFGKKMAKMGDDEASAALASATTARQLGDLESINPDGATHMAEVPNLEDMPDARPNPVQDRTFIRPPSAAAQQIPSRPKLKMPTLRADVKDSFAAVADVRLVPDSAVIKVSTEDGRVVMSVGEKMSDQEVYAKLHDTTVDVVANFLSPDDYDNQQLWKQYLKMFNEDPAKLLMEHPAEMRKLAVLMEHQPELRSILKKTGKVVPYASLLELDRVFGMMPDYARMSPKEFALEMRRNILDPRNALNIATGDQNLNRAHGALLSTVNGLSPFDESGAIKFADAASPEAAKAVSDYYDATRLLGDFEAGARDVRRQYRQNFVMWYLTDEQGYRMKGMWEGPWNELIIPANEAEGKVVTEINDLMRTDPQAAMARMKEINKDPSAFWLSQYGFHDLVWDDPEYKNRLLSGKWTINGKTIELNDLELIKVRNAFYPSGENTFAAYQKGLIRYNPRSTFVGEVSDIMTNHDAYKAMEPRDRAMVIRTISQRGSTLKAEGITADDFFKSIGGTVDHSAPLGSDIVKITTGGEVLPYGMKGPTMQDVVHSTSMRYESELKLLSEKATNHLDQWDKAYFDLQSAIADTINESEATGKALSHHDALDKVLIDYLNGNPHPLLEENLGFRKFLTDLYSSMEGEDAKILALGQDAVDGLEKLKAGQLLQPVDLTSDRIEALTGLPDNFDELVSEQSKLMMQIDDAGGFDNVPKDVQDRWRVINGKLSNYAADVTPLQLRGEEPPSFAEAMQASIKPRKPKITPQQQALRDHLDAMWSAMKQDPVLSALITKEDPQTRGLILSSRSRTKNYLRKHLDGSVIGNEYAQQLHRIEAYENAVLNNQAPEDMLDMANKWKSLKNEFSGSAFIDGDGNPMTFWHGTTGDFEEFQLMPSVNGKVRGLGVYVGPRDDAASWTVDVVGGQIDLTGSNVRPVYVKSSNPYTYSPNDPIFNNTPEEITRILESQGYDSVVTRNLKGDITEIVVFDPKNVYHSYQYPKVTPTDVYGKHLMPEPSGPLLPSGVMAERRQRDAIMLTRAGMQDEISRLTEHLVKGQYQLPAVPKDIADELKAWANRAVDAKAKLVHLAMDGGKMPDGRSVEGAIDKVNHVMIDYTNNSRFDLLMKNVFPFWTFPSRSLPFWMETMITHPYLLAIYNKLRRVSSMARLQAGATDSKGRPLTSLENYLPIPGTSLWFNPLAPFSMMYTLNWIQDPQDLLYDAQANDEIPPQGWSIAQLMKTAPIFGLSTPPWLTIPLKVAFNLPDTIIPATPIIPQVPLIPRWMGADLISRLGPIAGNIYDVANPEVSWHDYLVERDLLEKTLQDIRGMDPASARDLVERVSRAIQYKDRKNDAGEYDNPEAAQMWLDALKATYNQESMSRAGGFFFGVYAKPFSDSEADLLALRNQRNLLKSALNNHVQAALFDIPVDPTNAWERYNDSKDTPEGWLYRLYVDAGYVRDPDTNQIVRDPAQRAKLEAITIENEYKQSTFYALSDQAASQLNKELQAAGIGAPWEKISAIYDRYYKRLDEISIYNTYEGYYGTNAPIEIVMSRIENEWFRRLWQSRPRFDPQGDESYVDYEKRVQDWENNLQYMPGRAGWDVGPRIKQITSHLHTDQQLPDAFWKDLIGRTNAEGFNAWRRKTDTIFDALNNGWEELYWKPFWDAHVDPNSDTGWKKGADYQLATHDFYAAHPNPPSADELWNYVQANYPGRFTKSDVYHWVNYTADEGLLSRQKMGEDVSSEYTVERRLAEQRGERAQVIDEIWDLLSYVGPGRNRYIVQDEMALGLPAAGYGGKGADALQSFYDTGGASLDFNTDATIDDLKTFRGTLKAIIDRKGLPLPTREQLTEWKVAEQDNADLKQAVIDKANSMTLADGSSFFPSEVTMADVDMLMRNLSVTDYELSFHQLDAALFKTLRDIYTSTKNDWGKTHPMYNKYYNWLPEPPEELQPLLQGRKVVQGAVLPGAPVVPTTTYTADMSTWPEGFADAAGPYISKDLQMFMARGGHVLMTNRLDNALTSLLTSHPEWKPFIDRIRKIY